MHTLFGMGYKGGLMATKDGKVEPFIELIIISGANATAPSTRSVKLNLEEAAEFAQLLTEAHDWAKGLEKHVKPDSLFDVEAYKERQNQEHFKAAFEAGAFDGVMSRLPQQ